MANHVLSVVIPSRNRCALLHSTLEALDKQENVGGPFEVIVVDDGSSDDTPNALLNARFSGFELKALSVDPGGPARARNRGIAEARATRVLLLGDDTLPMPGTLAAHLNVAGSKEVGVQGRIDWDSEHPITPVMEFLAPEGPQFYFKGLSEGSRVPYTVMVSANLSAPRRWFVDEPFEERFKDACLEDTELAYRWRRRNRWVVFSERAACRHRHHWSSIEPFLERQRRAGQWARTAVALHPELFAGLVLQPVLIGVVVALRSVGRACVGRKQQCDHWNLRCQWAFLRGFCGMGRVVNV